MIHVTLYFTVYYNFSHFSLITCLYTYKDVVSKGFLFLGIIAGGTISKKFMPLTSIALITTHYRVLCFSLFDSASSDFASSDFTSFSVLPHLVLPHLVLTHLVLLHLVILYK